MDPLKYVTKEKSSKKNIEIFLIILRAKSFEKNWPKNFSEKNFFEQNHWISPSLHYKYAIGNFYHHKISCLNLKKLKNAM